LKRRYEQTAVAPQDAAFVRSLVMHEDEALLAFNKPAGLPVQTRNPDDRTLDGLLAAFARSNGKRPRLVHRLDAQTSGVIVAAKTQPAAAALSAAFAERTVRKVYLAIASGAQPDASGVVDVPLIRHRPQPQLELMRAARPGETGAQAALTRFRITASAGALHLVEAEPETGRMHQIRAHLSMIGLPIVGDVYYGGLTSLNGRPLPRLMLHALKLCGPHPSGGRFGLYAAPPADFTPMLNLVGDLAGSAKPN
jgi:23S rRNA pseudouridine955/2504/2580 synthase